MAPRSATLAALALSLAAAARAQLPTWPVTWDTPSSTYYYACRQDNSIDPALAANWSIINIDWSNEKDIWAKEKPMRCEERLFEQAQALKAARPPSARSWVYRNTCKALPWYSTVREKLVDPDFAPWFLRFGAVPPINSTSYFSPPCDDNYSPPLCSGFYHDSVCAPDEQGACQVPGYPTGDGVCDAPACDVGAVPSGEYVWDPRAWNVSVNGLTLGRWWIDPWVGQRARARARVHAGCARRSWADVRARTRCALPSLARRQLLAPANLARHSHRKRCSPCAAPAFAATSLALSAPGTAIFRDSTSTTALEQAVVARWRTTSSRTSA